MRLALCIFIASSLSALGQGFDGTSLTGTNINLAGQSGWAVYFNNDSPEGAYHHVEVGGVSNASVSIPLSANLSPGVWKVQLKTLDADKFCKAAFTLADAISTNHMISTRDVSDGWLQAGVLLTNSYATNRLNISFQTTNGVNIHLIMLALYWTTNLNEDLDPNYKDLIWSYAYPSSASTVVDNTNNIIVNSSFETSMGGWRPTPQNRVDALESWRVTGSAQHGNWALKSMEVNKTIVSPYFYVKDDSRKYTLSVYWLGSGTIRIKTPITLPAGYSAAVNTNRTLGTAAVWTRTNFVVELLNYPRRIPYVIELSGPSNTLFDAVMLHEGTNVAPFRTMGDLGLGWSNSVSSGIYYTNESSTPYIIAYNSSGGSRSVTINYEFVNQWNAVVTNGTITSTLADGGRLVQSVPLPATPGWYRAVCWSAGVSPQEAIIICMPTPIANDFVGTHNFGNLWQVNGMHRLGITWLRASSPQATFRWTLVEGTEGVFVWDDLHVTNVTFNGGHIFGDLGILVPAYAGTISAPDYVKWSNHVFAVVDHYKAWVSDWEIWNEPEQMTGVDVTVEVYTNLMKVAGQAIRAADPTAIRVGIGGVANITYITNVLDAFGADLTNVIDAFSIHGYPPSTDPFSSGPALSQAQGYTNLITRYNLPILNTESGNQEWGGALNNSRYVVLGGGIYTYTHQRPNFESMINVPWRITQHALSYAVHGYAKYFYYDSEVLTDAKWTDNHYSSWEGDDGHRPKIAALGVVNYMTAGTTGAGLLASRSNNVVFLYFENGNNSRCAVWTTNADHYTMTSTNVVPYDWMLTPKTITGNSYNIGRLATYLLPNGLTSSQFKSALTNASYAPVADTFAPMVNIFLFPGSTIIDTNRLLARWSLVDELSLPGKNNQSDLLTRSALVANSVAISDGAYDAWSTSVERVWQNVISTNMTLYVQGKDAAGNIETQTRLFGDSGFEPAGSSTRSVISGKVSIFGRVDQP